MVELVVAGRADSKEFVICERVLDILTRSLPDMNIHKLPHHPYSWPVESRKLRQKYGFNINPEEKAYVWSSSGRLIGNMDAVLDFAKSKYGIEHDLSAEDINAYRKENYEQLKSVVEPSL